MRTKNRFLLSGLLALATLGMAGTASAFTTCIPYSNTQMICSSVTFNPSTQQWETEVFYQPYQLEFEAIE